ncbi:shufflon system plasmid conjugative transfer pilus tip adhesin PilV [Escherichia coli]
MKKYDRGWASLETGAALLIVMLLIAWGAGIWQDYIQTKGWQTEARLVSNWTSAARSYIGKNYTTLQGSSTTTTPAVITTTMLKNTGFLSSGFTETNSEGQRLQAYVVRNAQNPELLQAMVVSSGGTPYPVKALIQMAKDITTGLGGYIQDGKTATGALRSWSVALSIITRNSKGWLNETHGGGFYMSDGSWVRSVNNKGIYTGGQVKGGTVRADGRLYTGEYLQLERTAVAGASCSPNGLVGRDNTGAILSCQSGTWGTIGGKLKVTQLSTTGYLGQFDFCAIARMGNAEDAHYCQGS